MLIVNCWCLCHGSVYGCGHGGGTHIWAGVCVWFTFTFGLASALDGDSVVSADMGYARGSLQGREQGWRMGAGWEVVSGATGHSLSIMGTHGCLSREVPMAL